MKTMKKVWRYIAKYKKLLTITLIAMLIVQALGLLAPLIVKSILDDYLVGIERPWYEVSKEEQQVTYSGRYFSQDVISDDVISIVIFEGKYYIVEDSVVRGNKDLNGTTLTIVSQEGITYNYEALRLTKEEVVSFYQPFVKPLVILIIILTVRFFLQTIFHLYSKNYNIND